MYKLNLMPYNYTVKGALGKDGKPTEEIKQYDVKEAITNVILSPRQGLNGFRQYTVGKTAMKINKCPEPFILLDSVEHEVVKQSFDKGMGYGPNDAQLLIRIYEMEEVK
jgi:hypothetical protein